MLHPRLKYVVDYKLWNCFNLWEAKTVCMYFKIIKFHMCKKEIIFMYPLKVTVNILVLHVGIEATNNKIWFQINILFRLNIWFQINNWFQVTIWFQIKCDFKSPEPFINRWVSQERPQCLVNRFIGHFIVKLRIVKFVSKFSKLFKWKITRNFHCHDSNWGWLTMTPVFNLKTIILTTRLSCI